MLKRKFVPEPSFWKKDGFYIVPYGQISFEKLRNEFPNVHVIFIKKCTPMSICKEMMTEHNWKIKDSDYYIINDTEINLNIEKFQITIENKTIKWDVTNFLHRDTNICDDCFIIGKLTPKNGCLIHISVCTHTKLQIKCKFCNAKSFASFWCDVVNCIQTTENLFLVCKQTHKKYDFKCFSCNHIFLIQLDCITNGQFCPYCANRKLCGKKECNACYQKSFASFDIIKQECIQTTTNLLQIFKHSQIKYDFKCMTCKHIFSAQITHVVNGQFCPYCVNKKLCGKEGCTECYQKSFASFDIVKRNCIQTDENLLLIFKHSNKKYDFKCFICNHIFSTILNDVLNNKFCPYCANQKLCGKEDCITCYQKSFASYNITKRNCIQTTENLLNIFKKSNKKYDFKCFTCTHIFSRSLDHISKQLLCPFCQGRVCGKEACSICAKQCIMAKCSKKAQKQTRITKRFYCEEHFKDCISRDPNEMPLIHRAKISIEIYTFAELQRLSINDDSNFYWAYPTNWDCKMIPNISYKPDNLFCFDKNSALLKYADEQILNMNNLGYAIIIEILEEGKHQHSKSRSISDEDRELEIREMFDIFHVPIGFLYVSMAHTQHLSAHPDDIFFQKNLSGEYEVIASRRVAFSSRITDIKNTLNSMFENKLNQTNWIGH